jgi:hypothetical protein
VRFKWILASITSDNICHIKSVCYSASHEHVQLCNVNITNHFLRRLGFFMLFSLPSCFSHCTAKASAHSLGKTPRLSTKSRRKPRNTHPQKSFGLRHSSPSRNPARSARREPLAVTKALPRIIGLRQKRRHSPRHRSSFSHFGSGAWTDVNPVCPVELAQLVCIRALAICR